MESNEKKDVKIKRGGRRQGAGRPLGVPNRVGRELRARAAEHTDAALGVLVEICNDEAQSGAVRVQAAIAILDRGHGKPWQAMGLEIQENSSFSSAEIEERERELRERRAQGVWVKQKAEMIERAKQFADLK